MYTIYLLATTLSQFKGFTWGYFSRLNWAFDCKDQITAYKLKRLFDMVFGEEVNRCTEMRSKACKKNKHMKTNPQIDYCVELSHPLNYSHLLF